MIRVEYDFKNFSYKVEYETDGGGITTAHYREEDAMSLVKGLTEAGVSSVFKDAADNEYQRGFLAAQSAHLEDLRRLTFLEDKDGRV